MAGAVLKSMTGFGKAKVEEGDLKIDVEVRTLNHRFLDCSLRLPQPYTQFELDLRSAVASRLERGKVEVFVTRRLSTGKVGKPILDQALFDQYWELYEGIFTKKGASLSAVPAALLDILSRKEVVISEEEEQDPEREKPLLFGAINDALDRLNTMREAEGARLDQDLRNRLATLAEIRQKIQSLSLEAGDRHRERLLSRLQKVSAEIRVDETRLAQEVAFILERLDIAEELTRLESHFQQCSHILSNPPNGRRLEFLVQELGREFNTITSKCQDAPIQSLCIDAKAVLEKMREQIQNVE